MLCGQAVICFSIISACVPYLKFLIDALETGMVRADARPAGGTKTYGSSIGGEYYKSKGLHSNQRSLSGVKSPLGANGRANALSMNSLNNERYAGRAGNQVQNVASKASRTDDDVDSQSSQTHIIKKVEWTLTDNHTGMDSSMEPSRE